MEPTDGWLVRACRRGDEAAWETLIRRYQRLVLVVARRAGLEDDAAADVFQEVFVALVEGLDRIDEPDRISSWILTTAKRATWRMVRRRAAARARLAALDEEFEETPDAEPLPEHVLLRFEEQHQVRTALHGLDDRCRQLLTLLFYTATPPPYSEVAAGLGIAEGSVGPIRARCLERLQRLLRQPPG
jgi:RNA polymerase sigma factor (sigma-70 family)